MCHAFLFQVLCRIFNMVCYLSGYPGSGLLTPYLFNQSTDKFIHFLALHTQHIGNCCLIFLPFLLLILEIISPILRNTVIFTGFAIHLILIGGKISLLLQCGQHPRFARLVRAHERVQMDVSRQAAQGAARRFSAGHPKKRPHHNG